MVGCGGSLTGTLDEGPVVAPVRRTETLIQHQVLVSRCGPGTSRLHWAPVGALGANPPAGVTGVATPAALGPFQTL